MDETWRLRPVDERGHTVDLSMSSLQDENGVVDFDQTWPSLFLILDALDVDDVETAVDAEELDPIFVAKLADALAPHDWGTLMSTGVIEPEDLPEPAEIVERYYARLRELAIVSADENVAWHSALD